MKIQELFVLLFLTVVLVFFKYITYGSIDTSSITINAWMFPNILLNTALILIILLGIVYRKEILLKKEIHNIKLVIITIGTSISSFLIWQYIHFILSIILLLLVLGYTYNIVSKKYIIGSIFTSILLYFFFVHVFNILL